MYYIFILFLFVQKDLYSQSEYKLLVNKDTTAINQFRFNYSSIEKQSSNLEKLNVIKSIINLSDTSSVLYFAGYDEYYEFILDFQNLVDSIPKEYNENIHFVKLNNDTIYDVIYDRINFGWDFQSIYVLINKIEKTELLRLPGFIIVNIKDSNKIIKTIESYQWTCCDSHYNFYFNIFIENDTINIKELTIIPRRIVCPNKIVIDETKNIKHKNLSSKLLKIYIDENNYVINDLEDDVIFSDLKFIDELLIKSESYVFVKARILNNVYDADYILAWIRKEDIIITQK